MNDDQELVCLQKDYWQMLYALLSNQAMLESYSYLRRNIKVTMTPPGRDSDEIFVIFPSGTHVFTFGHQGVKYLGLSNEEKFIPFGKFPELYEIIRQIFQ